jgi:hypothetical protein
MLKLFNKAMERYETANIETKMKARLFFILSLVMLIILPIAISYTTYLRLMYPVSEYKVNLDILIP